MQAPSDVANRQWWENRLANTSFNDVALAVVEHNVGAGEQSAGNNLVGFRASTTWKNSRARETTACFSTCILDHRTLHVDLLVYMYTHEDMDERVAMIWCFDGE